MSSLTVEIFQDQTSEAVDLEPLHEGLAAIKAIVGNMKIVGGGREVIAQPDSSSISANAWRGMPDASDIAVIGTARPIDLDGGTPLGVTIGRRVIIVSVGSGAESRQITSHEFGHALGLRYAAGKHCDQQTCIMYPALDQSIEQTVLAPRRNVVRLLEWAGVLGQRVRTEKVANDSFCDDCVYQLDAVGGALRTNRLNLFGLDGLLLSAYTSG